MSYRRHVSPYYKVLPQYEPITGERAALDVPGISPQCAMAQIAAKDTHCDYVICRLYDPRDGRYYPYEEGDADKVGVPVAKPYWACQKGVYRIGQGFPAFPPLASGGKDGGIVVPQIGQNPGIADGGPCQGHPLDLEEEILTHADGNGVFINWMLIDGGRHRVRFCTKDNHPGMGVVFEAYGPGEWNSGDRGWDFTCDADHTHKIIDLDYGVPEPDKGAQGYADWEADDEHGRILVVVTMDCDARDPNCCS